MHEGRLVTFFIAKKVTKKSSRSKNSLIGPVFFCYSVLLSRFFWFHFLFLSFVITYRVLTIHETDHQCSSNNFERRVRYPIRIDFLKKPVLGRVCYSDCVCMIKKSVFQEITCEPSLTAGMNSFIYFYTSTTN